MQRKINLLDGGSYGGLTKPFKGKDLNVISFDPNDNGFCLSDYTGTGILYQTREKRVSTMFKSSSYFKEILFPNKSHLRDEIGEIPVPVIKIDDLSEDIDIIKLDIHGSEFYALNGAKRQLKDNVTAVLVEVWLVNLYETYNFGDIHKLLTSYGFSLVDSVPTGSVRRGARRHIFKLDCLYLKEKVKDIDTAQRIADIFGFNGFYKKEKKLFVMSRLLDNLAMFLTRLKSKI